MFRGSRSKGFSNPFQENDTQAGLVQDSHIFPFWGPKDAGFPGRNRLLNSNLVPWHVDTWPAVISFGLEGRASLHRAQAHSTAVKAWSRTA